MAKNWRLCSAMAASACKSCIRLAAIHARSISRSAASHMQVEPMQVAAKSMQNWKNLQACNGHMDSNCMRLAAKLQTRLLNLHALAAITMQSRQYCNDTGRTNILIKEWLQKIKIEDPTRQQYFQRPAQ